MARISFCANTLDNCINPFYQLPSSYEWKVAPWYGNLYDNMIWNNLHLFSIPKNTFLESTQEDLSNKDSTFLIKVLP